MKKESLTVNNKSWTFNFLSLGGLSSRKSCISFKDWLAIDKQAAKDLCNGIRFIHGRKPRNVTTSPPISTQVNAVRVVGSDVEEDEEVMEEKEEVWEEKWDGGGEESDSESYLFDSEFEDEDNDGYQSDTSITQYPYNPESMGAARPFAVEVQINGVKVEAIADTGASVSVISKPLAKRLKLPINKDLMSIQQLDERDTKPNGICVNVPVQTGGKLRREHCSVLDRESDLLLLGLPWMRAYGVKIDPTTLTLSIPTQESKKDIVVQRYTRYKSMESEAATDDESTSPQVFMLQLVQQETSQSAHSELHGGPSVAYNGDIRVDWYDGGASEGGMSQEGENGEKEKSEKEKIRKLLSKYQDCFVEHAGLGRVNLLSHEIKTTTETPIKSKPYRLTWAEEAQLRKELDHLLELGLIKPSKGEWTSPVLFVGKKDGSLRLCVDYRRLNKITVKDHFPLPFIDELIDSMGGARYFSTLDAASGYWQVPMHENSIHKTGFVTKYGVFDWCVLPFGLTSAPATFQRLMTQLLQPLLGKCVHVFIDDIIIYSRTLEEHVQHLEQVFNICKDANLRIKLAKCTFASDNVEYLGHQITKDGLKPTERNVKKVKDMVAPKNKSEVRSLLGMVGYYRRFIPDFANKAQAIQKLTRNKVDFEWGPEQEKAFEVLKDALITPPVLAYPDPTMVQILTTDASGKGIGAILSQSADGSSDGEQVIAYASRALRGAETRYATTHVEALAIVAGMYQFRHYLRGRKFVLYTDHSALTYILNNPAPSPKVSRWSAATMEYDFAVKHRKGENCDIMDIE
ncbi:krab-a domain-containing protein [Lichtheimia corymbifera JMRC:FSU:9682]|uniref:Krab-a domain-containing protein n=1 Tax=Lichtheimia corymbifera JMRC:FSU:9682 TaxID=1263082 RepID=A0A068SIA1_9FUNG|nr:krab-a domain-containing protein [Lichtheimia corymbifera JMRC:FSU:9682]